MSDEVLCQKCAGLCCRYIALPIDEPEDFDEFEDVRWYLAHEGISVFVEDDQWYINMASRCRFLGKDNLCGIYEDRPRSVAAIPRIIVIFIAAIMAMMSILPRLKKLMSIWKRRVLSPRNVNS